MTISPFRIDGPATISFSGGRTSGYMLRRILDEGLRPDVYVLFANTGKESEETLDFIHEIETRWSVPIHWLEYRAEPETDGTLRHTWAEVAFAAAARNGEPFASLIKAKSYLPNPVTRFCTQELKIRVMQKWAQNQGFEHWTTVVGIRADELRRVAKMAHANEHGARCEVVLPLAEAGVDEAAVLDYWRHQPFNLRLQSWEGNCDLCFLKGRAKKERVIRDHPDSAQWWVDQETLFVDSHGRPARFRSDAPSYASMVRRVTSQPMLPLVCDVEATDDLGDCICHD